MVNGVKVSLVYHLYCKDVESLKVGGGNLYNEINRRCLTHFHDIFDEATFCVAVDDTHDHELIEAAVRWIWSCGFGENTTIKVRFNSQYRGAKTFYDEIATRLADYDGMVFYAHNKGCSADDTVGTRQWVIFSYYACLRNIEEKISFLCLNSVACVYAPIKNEWQHHLSKYDWLACGGIFLLNPAKIKFYLDSNEEDIPILHDRFYDESFISNVFDITKILPYKYAIRFDDANSMYLDGEANCYTMNHLEFLSIFFNEERVKEYQEFYEKIMEGL